MIVVASDHAPTITDCLDGVAAVCPPEVEVWVADRGAPGTTADRAIRHARVDRVIPVAPDLQQVLDLAGRGAAGVVLLEAELRPDPGWFAAALDALERSEVVLGPDHRWGNMALDLRRLRDVRLLVGDGRDTTEELVRRARSAGAGCVVVDGLRASAARVSDQVGTGLPTAHRLPDGPRHPGTISVVVCTRDRPQHLERCLRALERLCDGDHEIVVVDNHERPTVDPGACPQRARVVHEPRRGLDVARNRGVAESHGDVIAYIDDDCEADPRWLDALRAAFADPTVGAVTGRVRPAHLSSATERRFEAAFSFDRGLERRRFTPWDDRPWYPLWAGALGTGCNMAFRRDVIVGAGGFDELLDVGSTVGGGGDLDILARLLDRGTIVEYTPDAQVWHHHRQDDRMLSAQFRGYGESAGALLMKAVLDRPGLRVKALRYFGERLANQVRLLREARRGNSVLTEALVATTIRGQLQGPVLYLLARAAARRG